MEKQNSLCSYFFFSSRRRHTRCSRDWSSECALPICVHVEPLLDEIGAELRMPLDVGDDEQMRALFDAAAVRWGRLDFVLHAVAYAPRKDLQRSEERRVGKECRSRWSAYH